MARSGRQASLTPQIFTTLPLKKDGFTHQVKKTLGYPVSLNRVSILVGEGINNLKENVDYLVFQRYSRRLDLMPLTKML